MSLLSFLPHHPRCLSILPETSFHIFHPPCCCPLEIMVYQNVLWNTGWDINSYFFKKKNERLAREIRFHGQIHLKKDVYLSMSLFTCRTKSEKVLGVPWWSKDLALSLPWLGSLRWCGFNPWLRNIRIPQVHPPPKKALKYDLRMNCVHNEALFFFFFF